MIKKGSRTVKISSSAAPWTMTLVDDGRTTDELVASLESKGIEVDDFASEIIDGARDRIEEGTNYNLIGIRGSEFPSAKLTIKTIFAAGRQRRYRKPSPRIGLLLRDRFPRQEDLGYRYVGVMQRVKWFCPVVLALGQDCQGRWIGIWREDNPPPGWALRDYLFVFLAA
jgi:hypothetical protein